MSYRTGPNNTAGVYRPHGVHRSGGGRKKSGGGGGGSNQGSASFLTGPLTRGQFRRERKADVRLQTRPLLRQIRGDIRASQGREQEQIPKWFSDYRAQLANLQGQSQAGYQNAQNAIQGFSTAGGEQDAANRAGVIERMQKDAQLRGTTVDPSVDVGQANAENQRSLLNQSTFATVAGQGANQNAYLGNRQAIASQEQFAQQQNERQRRRSLIQDLQAALKQKGDLSAQYRTTARESERKYALGVATIRGENRRAALTQKGENWRARLAALTSRRNALLSQKGQNARNQADNLTAKINAIRTQHGENRRNKADNKQSNINDKRPSRTK